jgi:hypothetical protein
VSKTIIVSSTCRFDPSHTIFCVDFKLIEVFGIAQSVSESQKRRIVDVYFEKYPSLRRELGPLQKDPGLIALLLDTLIDVEILQEVGRRRAFHKVGLVDAHGNRLEL